MLAISGRSRLPAVFPPEFLSPCHPPSRRSPAIGVSTSIPFDPRFAPSPTPSTCFCRCCRSSPECPHRRQNCGPGSPPRGLLPVPASHSSLDGIHSLMAENPLQRSARSPTSPPSAPLGL